MNNWERMKAGRLYNADSKDLEQYHKFGMETCDKFNRTPLWRKKRKQRLLEKLIPSAKDGGAAIFAPFYCEYGVNIHFGKGCFVNYKLQTLFVTVHAYPGPPPSCRSGCKDPPD